MILPVSTAEGGYDITLERGSLGRAGELLDLHRKVLIVTDDGVPEVYPDTVARQCSQPVLFRFPAGERSKNERTFLEALYLMTEREFTRTDCVAAVGGGVAGDLGGFAAACYMRGIDFYNIPTTLLAQTDSSVGGKTAVDLGGYKNVIGAFWQPKGVVIDPDTLKTLPRRQIVNGLAEALKMSVTSDPELFDFFETGDVFGSLDRIIESALRIKRRVVQLDEKETGLRKVLNFGHTLAHAMESADGAEHYLHGECVAAGMIPMCAEPVRKRLIPVLKKLGLPTSLNADPDRIAEAVRHDKKASGKRITVVYVPQIGRSELREMTVDEYIDQIRKAAAE